MKTAVITGANSGIGLALTNILLDQGWNVAALVRQSMPDLPRLRAAISSGTLRMYTGDLADAASRRTALTQLEAQGSRIDTIFNNAGVSTGSLIYASTGRELHFEVNTIAPYVVVDMLAPRLQPGGTIVNTSSDAVFFVRRYDPENLSHPQHFRRVAGPYGHSKLALTLWSQALAPTLAKREQRILSVSPGPIATPLMKGPGMPSWMRLLAQFTIKSPEFGANCLLNAVEGSYPSGSFMMKQRIKTIPFGSEAEQTLQVVATAACE
jgi:NAD(P)-dependent dehydrogenase (short-subunit alcohol dehydrogenase family)